MGRGFIKGNYSIFVVFFESADYLTRRAKHLGRLQSLKLYIFRMSRKSFRQINDFIR